MVAMKRLTWLLIAFTTLPFLFLLNDIDWSLMSVSSSLFLGELALMVGNVLGLMGISVLFWEFVLGIRQLVSLFTPDLVAITDIHKKLGKYGTLLIFLHVLLTMYAYLQDILWVFVPNFESAVETYTTFGRIGLILLLIVWVTSALIMGRMKYRPWLYLHYLSYPIVLLTYLHTIAIGTFLQTYPILRGLWVFSGLLFIALSVYRLLRLVTLGSKVYTVTAKELVASDLFILKFKSKSAKEVQDIKVGQYVYLQSKLLGESHPFTVVEFSNQEGEFSLAIKSVGDFTQRLAKLDVGQDVYIDGPYGVFTLEGQNAEPKIIIAGGVGVTPFVELVKQFGDQQTYFFNCNRYAEDVIYADILHSQLGDNYYDFLSREANVEGSLNDEARRNMIYRRFTANQLPHLVKNSYMQSNYFICGSKQFILDIEKQLHAIGVSSTNIFIEKFF